MGKKKGNEEKFYAASSAPTVPADTADAAYNLFSNATTTSLSIESDEIDGSDKDTGAFGDPFPGTKSITLEIGFNRDFTGPTAQAAIEAAALATTAAGSTIWGLLTTGVAGDEGRHFSGRILGFSLNSDHTGIGTGSLTLRLSGAYTVFTEA